MTCDYPNCDCPVSFNEWHDGVVAKCKRTVVCVYPACNCGVSFPDGYYPSVATECPNPRDPTKWARDVPWKQQRQSASKDWEPPSRDPVYQEARKVHALLLRCEGLNYREVGVRLGITAARASQMTYTASRKLIGAMRRCTFRFVRGSNDFISD